MDLLTKAINRKTVYDVDEVKFLRFGKNGLYSIGTRNLNGCSVVMIVSRDAAILAHIPPRPKNHNPLDLEAGDKHAQAKMIEVGKLYEKNIKCFQTPGSNWVLCAMFQGAVGLPDQQTIMENSLARLGLSYTSITYVAGARTAGASGKGTVFVDGTNEEPVVYVEDKQVSKGNEWATMERSASHSTEAAGTGSSCSYSTGAAPGISYSTEAAGTGSSFSYSTGAAPGTSYSAWSSASTSTPSGPAATVPEGSPYVYDEHIVMTERDGVTYYRFSSNGKNIEASADDWVEGTVEHEGELVPCCVYTGKKSGTKYWRWSLGDVSIEGKGKGKVKEGKGGEGKGKVKEGQGKEGKGKGKGKGKAK